MPDRTERIEIRERHKELFRLAKLIMESDCGGVSCHECPFEGIPCSINRVSGQYDTLYDVRERLGLNNAKS